jgi:hypothetical protein
MKLTWEPIESNHGSYINRAKVFGGWLVMTTDDVQTPTEQGYDRPVLEQGFEWRTSLCFVPDPKHEWVI